MATWDSSKVSLMSGALAEKPTAAKLAAVSTASDSTSPHTSARLRSSVGVGQPGSMPDEAGKSGLRDVAATGVAGHDLAVVEDALAPDPDLLGPSGKGLTFVKGVAARALQAAGVDAPAGLGVEHDDVGVGAGGQQPLLGVEVEPPGGVLAQDP